MEDIAPRRSGRPAPRTQPRQQTSTSPDPLKPDVTQRVGLAPTADLWSTLLYAGIGYRGVIRAYPEAPWASPYGIEGVVLWLKLPTFADALVHAPASRQGACRWYRVSGPTIRPLEPGWHIEDVKAVCALVSFLYILDTGRIAALVDVAGLDGAVIEAITGRPTWRVAASWRVAA